MLFSTTSGCVKSSMSLLLLVLLLLLLSFEQAWLFSAGTLTLLDASHVWRSTQITRSSLRCRYAKQLIVEPVFFIVCKKVFVGC